MLIIKINNYRSKNKLFDLALAPVSAIAHTWITLRRKLYEPTLSNEAFFRYKYKTRFNQALPLENPLSFNQKIQWRKLYEKNPLFTILADKYAVRQYVADRVGEQYLIPLVDYCQSTDEMDYANYPNHIVIKATHDCGSVILIRDKKDIQESAIKKQLNKALDINFYSFNREWHYKDIPPAIIVEKMLLDENGNIPFDFKLHTFGGKVEWIQVANPSHTCNTMFDADWKRLPFSYLNQIDETPIPPPPNLKKIVEIAEKLSEGINYVRVDLYVVKGQVYFGEMTLTPNGGYGAFTPNSYDLEYGKKFILDLEKYAPLK